MNFNSLSEEVRRSLVDKIIVIDKENTITNIERDIKDEIKYCCLPKHSNLICERLEGWWFQKSIEALVSDTPIFIAQSQVRSYVVSVSQEYTADNLPIDSTFDMVDLSDLDAKEKIFYEQLKLICLGNSRLQLALRDYYRAFQQRANWVRNDLLYVNELDDYERRLVDEWEHAFSEMQDDLNDYGDEITEDQKIKSGKTLFSSIDKKDIRIRPLCSEAFVMRGSYHILANQLKVGWHEEIDSIKSEIDGVYHQNAEAESIKDLNSRRAKVVGRISLWLESIDTQDNLSDKEEKINKIESRLEEIDGLLDRDSLEEKKQSALTSVADFN